jgi:ribosomal protein S12 methylthiotransferase accessory factor
MEMYVDFPGGARVDAHFGPYTVQTDQPPAGGGAGEYPTPFELFLASLATCAGIYVLGFCRQRGLPTEGISIREVLKKSAETGGPDEIDLEIIVPESFPPKYHDALVKSAEMCKVKKTIENPPVFNVTTVVK